MASNGRGSGSRLDRRAYIKSAGALLTIASFAGCSGRGDGDGGDGGGGGDGDGDGGTATSTSTAEPAGDVDMGGFMVPEESVVSASDVSDAAVIGSQEMSVVSQSNSPDMWNATQQWIEFVSGLGLEIEVRAHPRGAQLDWVWTNGHEPPNGNYDNWWDLTTWSFSPRPSRLDPDELLYNHHSSMQAGYNFIFWEDDEFDQLVEDQRSTPNQEQRRELIFQCQELLHERGPNHVLMYPDRYTVWNSAKWDGIIEMAGLGPRNLLTFQNLEPLTDDRMLVAASTEDKTFQFISPFDWGNENDIIQERMIYDRLMWPTQDGRAQPRLATEINYRDDTTIEMPIHEGHRFHDGSEVLAEDVKYSYELNQEYATDLSGSVEPIEGIEIADDHRLVFNLAYPYAPIEVSTFARVMIGKKSHWEEEVASSGFQGLQNYNPSEIIGSGPMRFDSWNRDTSEMTLRKYEDHFDPIAYDGRISTSIPGVEAALGQMASGDIDITLELVGNIDAIKRIVDQEDDLSIARALSVTSEWITFNNDKSPFHLDAMRRATYHAWNKDQVVSRIFDDEGRATHNGFVSPALTYWYHEELNRERYPNDMQAAANVLVDAGFRWDEEGTLYLPEGAPAPDTGPAEEAGLGR
jgi:peptide/nickel transport system substrate-binding protein